MNWPLSLSQLEGALNRMSLVPLLTTESDAGSVLLTKTLTSPICLSSNFSALAVTYCLSEPLFKRTASEKPPLVTKLR